MRFIQAVIFIGFLSACGQSGSQDQGLAAIPGVKVNACSLEQYYDYAEKKCAQIPKPENIAP